MCGYRLEIPIISVAVRVNKVVEYIAIINSKECFVSVAIVFSVSAICESDYFGFGLTPITDAVLMGYPVSDIFFTKFESAPSNFTLFSINYASVGRLRTLLEVIFVILGGFCVYSRIFIP